MAIFWKEIFSWTSVDQVHWWAHVLSAPTYHMTYAICDNANMLIDTLTGAILNMNVFQENLQY